MSGVWKGVKKVFKKAVDVVKKYWKPIVAVALGVFTAGVATAGFAAFGGVNTVGGFMAAAGKTMAIGAQATMGSLGLTQGVTAGTASGVSGLSAGTTLGTGKWATAVKGALGSSGGGGAAEGGLAYTDKLAAASGGGSSVPAGGSAFLSKMGGALKGFAGTDTGKLMIAQGIMGGISNYMEAKEARRQERRHDEETIWGAQRRGGEGGSGLLDMPEFGDPDTQGRRPPTPSEWREVAGPINIDQAPEQMPGYNQVQENQQQPQQPGRQSQGGLLAQYQQNLGQMGLPQYADPKNPNPNAPGYA